jgi:hypothetical protein
MPISDPKDLSTIDFDDTFSSSHDIPVLAEKRLLVAMIQRALIDYCVPVPGSPHLQRDAARWLFSPPTARVMSLFWVCEHLSESPKDLHRIIQIAAKKHIILQKSQRIVLRVDTR